MTISFEDGSYIDCRKPDASDKIVVIISAKDGENPLKRITNAVEISLAEFKQLISDVSI